MSDSASGSSSAASDATAATPAAPADLPARVEAALLTTDRALTAARLAEALGVDAARPVQDAIAELNAVYEKTGRSFRIEQVAGGYQVMTLPQYADVLASLHQSRSQAKLSPAAMETLAIVAYKQPILRAEIESIRGVACGEVLRSLMDRHLVKIVGRAEEIGRPMLYGTTKAFLEVFGLASLKDLPKVEDLVPPKASGDDAGEDPASDAG
ncbi:MAG: SMC-Scp complex subunit ScpB [Phycisphaeraceae bacterium]